MAVILEENCRQTTSGYIIGTEPVEFIRENIRFHIVSAKDFEVLVSKININTYIIDNLKRSSNGVFRSPKNMFTAVVIDNNVVLGEQGQC